MGFKPFYFSVFYREHDIAFHHLLLKLFNTNGSETVFMLSYNKYYVLFYLCAFLYHFLIHKAARVSDLKQ